MSSQFYDATDHGLPHDPIKAIVAPRPIGWISTYGADGTPNLAPYSFCNLVSDRPKIVMFASVGWKDSATHAAERGAFAANLATLDQRIAVNESSAALPRGESEFERAGLTPVTCRTVDAPRIEGCGAVLECRVTQTLVPRTVDGGEAEAAIVFGQVMGYWIDDRLLDNGLFNTAAAQPLSRLGYFDYAAVTETFELRRPKD